MAVYWGMFAAPAFFAMISRSGAMQRNLAQRIGLGLIFVAFVLIIGLRFEVGADWFNYEYITQMVALETFGGSLSVSDPAFAAVAWVSAQYGLETYGPSFVSGLILMIGVLRFCRHQADSWLALCAAVPYLLIVVGMGYVRQGAAIGFILIALLAFERGSVARTGFYMLLAATFHVTALAIAPLLAMVTFRRNPLVLIPTILVGIGLGYVLLQQRIESFLEVYSTTQFDSSGTMIRLAMNAIPSIIFLLNRRRFELDPKVSAFWTLTSLLSLALIPAVALTPSTTVVDRLGLYLIPIQLLVFGNMPTLFSKTTIGRVWIVSGVVLYYAAVLFVWLNFATHAEYWLPYRFLGQEIG